MVRFRAPSRVWGWFLRGCFGGKYILFYSSQMGAKSAVKKFPQYFRLWCGDVEHGDGGDREVYYE